MKISNYPEEIPIEIPQISHSIVGTPKTPIEEYKESIRESISRLSHNKDSIST